MANTSILAAFERMWQHVANALSGKSDISHNHDERYYTGAEVDTKLSSKANSSHGTHVSYSSTAPVMDGTASVGSASTVARSDHKHPTDTSRAAASDLTTLQSLVGNTAVSTQINNAMNTLREEILGGAW